MTTARQGTREPDWITPSDLGDIAFCPKAAYFARHGVERSFAADERAEQGTRDHERWNERQAGGPSARLGGVGAVIALICLVVVAWFAAGLFGWV